MISIYKSYDLNNLATHLANRIKPEFQKGLFHNVDVLVPNMETARWLTLFLTEKHGYASNINYMLPAEWQWRQIRKLYPDLPKQLPSDLEPMTWALFKILNNPDQCRKFPELEMYIRQKEFESRELAAFQLAGQISSIFDQYLVYRPELIISWQNNRQGSGDEQWQSDLWRLLVNQWNRLEDNLLNKNRAELFYDVLKTAKKGRLDFNNPLFVYNPGLIPAPVLQLMNEYGKHSEILFYLIQPSKNPGKGENLLLKRFGQESKQIVESTEASLAQKAEFIDGTSVVKSDTLLGKIKDSIISGGSVPESETMDQSIHIRSCYSELREVETLHHFLLDCFEKNSDISPDDVLVVTPNLNRYEPFISAVFGVQEKGLPEIPFTTGFSSSGLKNEIIHEFESLIELLDSRYYFENVMDLIKMPAIRRKLGISISDTHQIERWTRDNGVIWGLDANHRQEFSQPGEDLQTWRIALKRGWLGQLVGGKPGEMNGNTLLYHGIGNRDKQQVWASFSRFISFLEKAHVEIKRKRTGKEWIHLFLTWSKQIFSKHDMESLNGLKLAQTLEKIADEVEMGGFNEVVAFSIMKKRVLQAFESTSTGTIFFTRGIVFSSMVPARSLPFKIIALLGLNDDTFPRKPIHPDFDLMAQNPRESERDRKKEDKNLFLESILSAGKIHYCSYIGRSQKDDEYIPPSPIVSEWVDTISFITGVELESVVKQEPLFGYSQQCFANDPESYSEAYRKVSASIGRRGTPSMILKDTLPELEEQNIVVINELERFFKNPLKAFFRARMGVRLETWDDDFEEFKMDHLKRHIFFGYIFGWIISGKQRNEMNNLLLQSGMLPSGWPGEVELDDFINSAQTSINQIKDHNHIPDYSSNYIDITLSDNRLSGFIQNYSKDSWLDIHASSTSGSVLFTSWIRFLCLCTKFADLDYFEMVCNLKKKPQWFRYSRPENPEILLNSLLSGYYEGLLEPLMFFPKTAWAYIRNTDDPKSAEREAGKEWKNYVHTLKRDIGEQNDPYIHLFLGIDPEPEFKVWPEIFIKYMKPMADHLEEMQ